MIKLVSLGIFALKSVFAVKCENVSKIQQEPQPAGSLTFFFIRKAPITLPTAAIAATAHNQPKRLVTSESPSELLDGLSTLASLYSVSPSDSSPSAYDLSSAPSVSTYDPPPLSLRELALLLLLLLLPPLLLPPPDL